MEQKNVINTPMANGHFKSETRFVGDNIFSYIQTNPNSRVKFKYEGRNVFITDTSGSISKAFKKIIQDDFGGIIPIDNRLTGARNRFYRSNYYNADTGRFRNRKGLFTKKGKLRRRFESEYILKNGGRVVLENPFEASTGVVESMNGIRFAQNFTTKPLKDVPSNLSDFYKMIKKTIGAIYPREYVNVKFGSGGNLTARAVPINSFEDFRDRINLYSAGGNVHGSDAVADGLNLDTSFFQHVYFGVNADDGNLFIDEAGGSNDGVHIKSKRYVLKNYESVNNNCFIACMVDKRRSLKECEVIREELFLKFGIEYGKAIRISDIPQLEKHFNKSIDVMDENGKFIYRTEHKSKDKVRLLLKDSHYTRIIRARYVNKKKNKSKKRKELLFFYDLETIFDKNDSNFLKPYSASWFIHDPENEFVYDENKHFKQCGFSKGRNCMDALMKAISTCPKGCVYTICGFNSSRFDNFFLADVATKNCMLDRYNFMYVNNSILSMSLCNGNRVFDLCRFVASSLKKACDDFKTNPKKMEGYCHTVPQHHFNEGGFDGLNKFIDDNYDFVEKYNKLDVLSLCDLLMKVREGVKQLFGGAIITDYMTIGQMSYKIFTDKNEEELLKPKTLEDDTFIRSSLCAGRTQAYYKRNKYEGKLKMVDVKSLYPFVMMNREYPVGEYKETPEYVEGKLGIYRVKIISQNMKWQDEEVNGFMDSNPQYKKEFAPIVYPLRSEDKTVPLNWEHRGEINGKLTSIDIECIRRNGGDVEVYEGIYWEKKSASVFTKYLEPLMLEKNRQDELKHKKSIEYNVSLRELCKLFSNCLSGKVIQKNYEDIFMRVVTKKDLEEVLKKVEGSNFSVYAHGSNFYFEGKLKKELTFKPSSKPSQLGVFTYAYAREYMYETILNKYVCLYEDTDSALLPQCEYERLIKKCSDIMNTGKYGCLEEEVGDATKSIMLAPKSYCVVNENDKYKSKFKFKGIKKDDRYMFEEELFKKFNVDKHNDIKQSDIEKVRNENLFHKCLTYEMFEHLYDGKAIYVFQSQLTKSKGVKMTIQETHENHKNSNFAIKQMFLIKKITAPTN